MRVLLIDDSRTAQFYADFLQCINSRRKAKVKCTHLEDIKKAFSHLVKSPPYDIIIFENESSHFYNNANAGALLGKDLRQLLPTTPLVCLYGSIDSPLIDPELNVNVIYKGKLEPWALFDYLKKLVTE